MTFFVKKKKTRSALFFFSGYHLVLFEFHYILNKVSECCCRAFAFTLNMAEATQSNAELLEWPKKDKRRFLHVVYRVGDLDRTIK